MLSILTFNCQKAYQSGFLPYMKEILENRKYDFLLLQEVDPKTLDIIRPLYKKYKYSRLGAISPKTNSELYTCILYKNEFEFLRSDFITFTPMVVQEITETGSIAGIFKLPLRLRRATRKKKILLITTHLHASYHFLARKKELLQVKNQALHIDPKNECLKIIAGDMNNLITGELLYHDTLMGSEFTNISDFNEPTYNSMYMEAKHKNAWYTKIFLPNHISYSMKLDHIYMDSRSSKRLKYECKAVDVLASDHKPIELRILPRKRRKIMNRLKRSSNK